ncbi:MAG: type II toxin-antitoxin system prevent-host-death family antitoxin [Ilumatobacteraceae bacterium]
MTEVASRELRNNTRDVIMRAEQGELIVITVDGRPTAELRAIGGKSRWIPKNEFFANFHPADRAMLDDIRGPNVETIIDLDRRDDSRWGNA